MLLNPSHKVTFSGLPPDVLDAYVRYKKGTRALVAWFIRYSPAPERRVKSLPIKELASLAQVIGKTLKTIPDVIHFHFRETIAARKRLSKHFRGNVDQCDDEVDTVNHEHFTSSLSQIYADLCISCGKPNHESKGIETVNRSALLSTGLVNHYNALPVEEIESIEDDSSEASRDTISECSECVAAETLTDCDGKGFENLLVDDDLGRALEVTTILQRAQDISDSITSCWNRAGKGDIPFTTAAFMTNVAFASLRQVGVELLEHESHLDISSLHKLCCSLNLPTQPESKHDLLSDLQEIDKSIGHYRHGHRLSPINSCASCVQKPAHYIQSPAVHGNVRPNFLEAITDNIIHLVTSSSPASGIIRNSTPVYPDVGYLITHPDETSPSWSAVLGLHLLTRSYRTYLEAIPQANLVSQCRITSLHLARQALDQVSAVVNDKTCFPCRCPQTLAYHLQNLEQDLREFTKHKCWDLYFQSPWVAGNHVLEILDLCHYYGTRLFNYRHYIGAVLHSYNALQVLAGLEKIPILENLCEQFQDVLFPGGARPKHSFRACWGRYVGARLKFKKGHRARNSRDSWCMAIPAHAARRAAGLGSKSDGQSDDYTPETLMFKIKQQGYHVSDYEWTPFDKQKLDLKSPTGTTSTSNSRDTSATTTSTTTTRSSSPTTADKSMQSLSTSISECLTPTGQTPLPHARLNLFGMFRSFVRVVSRLSDQTHTAKTEQGINCICFASAILTGADRIVDARRLGKLATWSRDERACLDSVATAIRDVFQHVAPDAYLWVL